MIKINKGTGLLTEKKNNLYPGFFIKSLVDRIQKYGTKLTYPRAISHNNLLVNIYENE